jgi:D-lactate dehydrogenase
MDRIKIAFFDTKPYDKESFAAVNEDFGFDIHFFEHHLGPQTAALTKGFDAVCAFVNDRVDAETGKILIESGVKILALRCAGYNNVDLDTLHGKITVVRVPAYSPHAVAEHAVALILTLNRKTHRAYYRVRDFNFNINGLLGFDMYEKTAGIVGTGKIGKILAGILRGFGMEVLVYDKFPDEQWASAAGVKYVGLGDLYKKSDIISLHCPLTPETHYMINSETLAMMKSTVMIINTGRGGLIDSKALIKVLKAKKIGSAGLDVYEEEGDYFFEDFSSGTITDDVLARLITFNNVLVTSHQAFFTKEALSNIARTTLGNIADWRDGKELANAVCPHCA